MSFAFYYTTALILLMTIFLIKEWLDVEIVVFSVLLLLLFRQSNNHRGSIHRVFQ